MEKNLEIKKLDDIIEWADGIIRDAGYNEEKYKSDAASAYCHVKAYELWKIRDAVLKGMERHAVYTNALNQDISAKAAKIDLMQKEIDGRKAGYVALKARMDSERESAAYWKDKYTKLQEENDEIDKDSKTHYDMYKYGEELLKVKDAEYNNMCQSLTLREEEIENLKKELDARGEEIRKLNKCIMNKNESINTGNEVIINLRKEICVHEEENKRLSEKIMELKDTITELTHDIDNYQSWNADLHNDIKDWKATADANGLENQRFRLKIVKLEEEIEKLKVDLIHEREKNEKLAKAHAELENDMRRVSDKDKAIVDLEELKKKIAKLGEEYFILKREKEYYKNQERIRTDQLRATESKVEELYKQIEGLTNNCRSKSTEIARLAKEMSDIRHELNKEDDHGREGFKRYIKYIVKEEETKFEESWKARLNEELEAIFKEEETEVKSVHRMSSGRYPWGAEVNDIPCGGDSIE